MQNINVAEITFLWSAQKGRKAPLPGSDESGFILSVVTGGGGPIAVYALAQLDFTGLRDDQLVLKFRHPDQPKIESVEIFSHQGHGGRYITYRGRESLQ